MNNRKSMMGLTKLRDEPEPQYVRDPISDEDMFLNQPAAACEHVKCHPTERIWIPTHVNENGEELEKVKPHYYCIKCGEIEYIGPDKAKHFGYFSNILGDMRRYLDSEYKKGGSVRITKTILRLIMKELNRIDHFTDKFCEPFNAQKNEFKRIVKKFLPGLSHSLINSYFDPEPPVYDERNVNYYGKYYDELQDKYEKEMLEKEIDEDFSFY